MQPITILELIGDLDEGLIEKAKTPVDVRMGRGWIKWVAALFVLIVALEVIINLPRHPAETVPTVPTISAPANHYPYDDTEHLEYVGKNLDPMEWEGNRLVFNEITDMESYRQFNLRQEGSVTYYETGTAVYDLLLEYPVESDRDFLSITLFEKDGAVENCPDYPQLQTLSDRAPVLAKMVLALLDGGKAKSVSAYMNYSLEHTAALFTRPDNDGSFTVLASDSLSKIDPRLDSLLPYLKSFLGTKGASLVGDQELSLCYFYQTRLYQGQIEEDSFRYYAYFERDGLEYLVQFSSGWTLPGQNISALHNPPRTLHYVTSQEDARKQLADLLALIAE